jgi:hypothetical protein
VAVFSFVLTALLAAAGEAKAADPPVSASYAPTELTMMPGETRTAVLLVQNPTGTQVTIDRFVSLPRAGPVVATLDAAGKNSIASGGSVALTATVTVTAIPSSEVTIITTIDYTTVPSRDSTIASLTGSAVATLVVKAGAVPSAAPSAVAIASSGDSSLVDTHLADVYFTVQNTTATTLHISHATLTFPSFLEVNLAGARVTSARDEGTLDLPLDPSLTAGNGVAFHVLVRAPRGLQPGDALLVLSVTYDNPTAKTTGFTTGSHTLSLSVFGEAAVTGAFGAALAPALFVVPGLLFVLVIWFMWARIYPRAFPVDLTPPSALTAAAALAILGVLCALPFPVLYRALWDRDYRAVYGFTDIGRMCWLGIVSGLLGWLVGVGIRELIRRYRLMPGDSAPTVVRKLTRRRDNLAEFPNADLADQGRVYIIRDDEATVLVCPAIRVPPLDDAERMTAFAKDFEDRLGGGGARNKDLYTLLRGYAAGAGLNYEIDGGTVSRQPKTALSHFGRGRVIGIREGN